MIGDSSVKAQGLIAGKYSGAFLDPQDAATVFKSIPGKFHILATTASSFPGIGGGVIFANKNWLKSTSHFNMAVDLEVALLQSARNATQNLVPGYKKPTMLTLRVSISLFTTRQNTYFPSPTFTVRT